MRVSRIGAALVSAAAVLALLGTPGGSAQAAPAGPPPAVDCAPSCPNLSTVYGNVGITSDQDTAPGNVDGSGYSYSAEALAAKGAVPGAPIRSHGTTFTWPTASAGAPDNALASGQTVRLVGSAPTLGFLLASIYEGTGAGTVRYSDGTSQSFTLGTENWAGIDPTRGTPVITMPYRNGPGGRDDRPTFIYYAGVPLDARKTVTSVQLPDVGSAVGPGVPALHNFAVALAGEPNLARGRIATQSSDAFDAGAARAVDGDPNGSWFNNSVTHTDQGDHPWWQVDLGGAAKVNTINVWNRTDCCAERLDDFWIFVSATPFDPSLPPAKQAARKGVWSSHRTGSAPQFTSVSPKVCGRYVMVQLAGAGNLSLAEVEVLGTPPASSGSWVGTWGTAPAAPLNNSQGGFANHSIRNVVHTSVGGDTARVRFSNKFGASPLVLGKATVARRAAGDTAAAVPGSVRGLKFSGRDTVTIPPGADVQSDPLTFAVPADADLLVSVFTPKSSGPVTYHPSAQQISYLTSAGDHTTDQSGASYDQQTGSWFYVKEIDVLGSKARGSLVAFGDSITDGGYSTTGANHRWPDYLADRIAKQPAKSRLGVLNSGISANRLLLDGGDLAYGRSGLARLEDDVLDRTSVRTVILLQGINDMLQDPRQNRPPVFIAGYREFADRLHARGIRVLCSTITPFKGWWGYDAGLEATRTAVNEFIRTGGACDGVIDFSTAIQDPQDPFRMRPDYDAGDHLHPSDAGNAAMAAAIDLAKL
jgi:lysophospholipase L1-like esterase